ncbi:hypothetical protein FE257_013022 [Aspergillus nanangensis]|uniref:Zn(2)-C6 fungal-type domain-containing protein n=1 Tax=Aspergillus nanangensis TaxID=2582783 RepID=A0AAD4CF04_ASPNN|nr:hypothetical protein FE257_013022 [Aspergillus nanangensis]
MLSIRMDPPEPKQRRQSAMACDNCRRRKVRCTRGRPCQKCQDVALSCSYTSIPRRKGPKGPNAHVLNSLRGLLTEVSASAAGGSPHRQQQLPFTMMATTLHSNDDPESRSSSSPAPSLTVSHSSHSSGDRVSELTFSPSPPSNARRRISSTILGAHVGLFLKHLYPIMPVIDSDTMADCADPETLHPRRYAHLVSLAAATHLQLNLDIGEFEPSERNIISGHDLIMEAVRALCEFDPLESPHVDTLLTMFFLFCAYGNLNKSDYAWHYLSQTISYVQILNLDKEGTYTGLAPMDAEARRRVFWLIFVTERCVPPFASQETCTYTVANKTTNRAYALQTGRPVMLRPNIRKPSVLNSEVPALLYGFVSLITLFEQMVPDFYSWKDDASTIAGRPESPAINSMYQSISNHPSLLAEVSETHQVDYILSQQWLLVCLWNYQVNKSAFHRSDSSSTSLLPIHIPLLAARSALACLSSASMASIDAHGIGMEQKLYDIGESITHLAPHLLPKMSPVMSAVETKDLLKSILDVLSRTRGCESYLFSALLEKSHHLLQASHLPSAPTTALFGLNKSQASAFGGIDMDTPSADAGVATEVEELEIDGAKCHSFKPLADSQGDLYLSY